MHQILEIYTDGASKGNPGPSSCGYSIRDGESGEILLEMGIFLGERTNNQAEYLGLYKALEKAVVYNPREIVCFMDSELMARQMSGRYKIKNPQLAELAAAIRVMTTGIAVTYHHVLREKNTRADFLANEAIRRGTKVGEAFIYS